MVPDDRQLELRLVLEEVLAHKSRRYPVASGQGLDPCFCPCTSLFGLRGCHQTRTTKPTRAPLLWTRSPPHPVTSTRLTLPCDRRELIRIWERLKSASLDGFDLTEDGIAL